jgi:hypothetical protein
MKKILSILTLVCFVAINVSLAQTAPKAEAKATKTEAVKADEKASMPACCKHPMPGCSKEAAASKNCSPKEKADCMKAGEKAEANKKETKSGTN